MFTDEQRAVIRGLPSEPNRVKAAMQMAGITQVQLAAGVGLTQPQISEIANGNYTKLPLETAQRVAAFFGCSTDDLFPAREAVA